MRLAGIVLACVVACEGRELPQRGDVPVGTVLHALDEQGSPIDLRIDGIEPDPMDRDGELQLYTVSMRVGERWTNYCVPDPFGMQRAVMLAGAWDVNGNFAAPSAQRRATVTVACTAGPLGKCVRWGYKPWKSVDGRSLAEAHQACVRMTRADYCGDGRPHTVDGTWIDIYDPQGIQRSDPEGLQTEFEAGWGPNGATYINVPRWTTNVDEIVAECPDKLAGRVAVAGKPLSRDEILARYPETRVFNDHAARSEDKKHRPAAFAQAQR